MFNLFLLGYFAATSAGNDLYVPMDSGNGSNLLIIRKLFWAASTICICL
jgi:hypothetical protein